MAKGQMASSSSGASAPRPLPSAPPSYEEAVGLPAAPTPPTIHMPGPQAVPPYPVGVTQMPMPTPYAVPTAQMPVSTQVTTNPAQDIRNNHRHITLSLGPNPVNSLGPNPVKMICPSCHADITTKSMADHQPSAHICCIVLCLAGCCLCSCLPYCLSAFLSVHHFCPNCKAHIGTWKG